MWERALDSLPFFCTSAGQNIGESAIWFPTSNSSYFSKCFSKAFGMTPTEYMKN